MKKGELSVYGIAKQQKITPRWVRALWMKYLKNGEYPYPKHPGRKTIPLSNEERVEVKAIKRKHPLAGATTLEKLLVNEGKHIPHNRIHKILKEDGLAKNEPKKQERRKWIRYQRRHSNSLWHTDWFEPEQGEHILPVEDDASRFITGFGAFSRETAKNGVTVFEQAIKDYGCPKQTMTDHGPTFTSVEKETCKNPEPNEFQKCLECHAIKHIKAKVKHPQSNGKVEKLGDTLYKLKREFGSWDATIKYYNFKRPHWSLKIEECETPFKAYIRKMRPNTRIKFVREHKELVSNWAPEYIEIIKKRKK
jgi:putative transposase